MTIAYATWNAILARWSNLTVEAALLDCQGCSLPYKCCGFQPFVANFLLGAILERQGALPEAEGGFSWQALGLVPSARFRVQHAEMERTKVFDPGLVCGFFDRAKRACSIWEFRPGECSSYLCSPPSETRQKLSESAFSLEIAVSQMALVQLGFDGTQIRAEIDNLNHPERGILESPGKDIFEIYRQAWHWARHLEAEEVQSWMIGELL